VFSFRTHPRQRRRRFRIIDWLVPFFSQLIYHLRPWTKRSLDTCFSFITLRHFGHIKAPRPRFVGLTYTLLLLPHLRASSLLVSRLAFVRRAYQARVDAHSSRFQGSIHAPPLASVAAFDHECRSFWSQFFPNLVIRKHPSIFSAPRPPN
jgi:hypothetical protein